MPIINFSEVDEAGFKPLPEGVYTFEVSDVEMKIASSGRDMLTVEFSEVESGRKVWENFTFPDVDDYAQGKQMGLPFLKSLFIAAGFVMDGEVDIEEYAEDLRDVELKCRIVTETGNDGVERNAIKSYSPVE